MAVPIYFRRKFTCIGTYMEPFADFIDLKSGIKKDKITCILIRMDGKKKTKCTRARRNQQNKN